LEEVKRQLKSTVLVELLASDADANFDPSYFAQENPNLPRASWQVAWAEAFLPADGQQLLVDRWEPRPLHHTTFRAAFFMHQWLVGGSLLTSYGTLPGVKPTSMPDRLLDLVPYEPVN
jgi:hypothetical protein